MIWLRLLHIVAGIVWVGSAVVVALFLLPTARAAGAEGERFVARLMQRMGPAFGIAALLTLIPGFIMYARLSTGLGRGWVMSPTGVTLGAGAAMALLAVAVGIGVNNATLGKIGSLKKRLAVEGRVSTATEAADLARWQSRMEQGARFAAGCLLLAAGAMAVARYL